MINDQDVLSLNYLKKQPFTGSCNGLRYRLCVVKNNEDSFLEAHVWPEPLSMEKTEQSLIQSEVFSVSEEGRKKAIEWIGAVYRERFETAQ